MLLKRIVQWMIKGKVNDTEKNFEKRVKEAKKNMRKISTLQCVIEGWEYGVRTERLKRKEPLIYLQKEKEIRIKEKQSIPVISHIALGNKYLMIDEGSIIVPDPKKDWMDTKKIPRTESDTSGEENAKKTY
jgi:hypothetical protein